MTTVFLSAIDQAETMTAVAGTDHTFWHDGIGLFGAGTPLANDAGIKVLRRPRDYPAVRQALTRAGYNGEKIVVLAPTDAPGATGKGRLERLLRVSRRIDSQHQPLWQPRIEALRAAWLDAGNLDEQRRICVELQMQLWHDVPYIPMGEYWQSTAYRKDLVDVLPGCFAVFWGIRRV
jgi:peptide/nickel transport system substrate-binding protein